VSETETLAAVETVAPVAFDPRHCGCGAKIVRHGRGVGRCETLGPVAGVSDASSRWSRPRASWVCLLGARADRRQWPNGQGEPHPPAGFVEETQAERALNRPPWLTRREVTNPTWTAR
jgi:hypothetical protein